MLRFAGILEVDSVASVCEVWVGVSAAIAALRTLAAVIADVVGLFSAGWTLRELHRDCHQSLCLE